MDGLISLLCRIATATTVTKFFLFSLTLFNDLCVCVCMPIQNILVCIAMCMCVHDAETKLLCNASYSSLALWLASLWFPGVMWPRPVAPWLSWYKPNCCHLSWLLTWESLNSFDHCGCNISFSKDACHRFMLFYPLYLGALKTGGLRYAKTEESWPCLCQLWVACSFNWAVAVLCMSTVVFKRWIKPPYLRPSHSAENERVQCDKAVLMEMCLVSTRVFFMTLIR